MPRLAPVHWRTLAQIFERDGWQFVRIKGDHRIYTKSKFARPIVIPMDSSVEVFIISNNLRTARISRERYFELLRLL